MSYLVDLQNITKHYENDGRTLPVLKEVSVQVTKGEMLAIVGASGSGKSTLMNIMGFLDICSSGKYFFSGNDVSQLSDIELSTIRNQKIGFVFQSFFLLPRLSVLQNVTLPLFYRGEKKEIMKKKAISILKKVGIESHSSYKPSQLSGGQQQRVAIARALISNPDIILADEPTGALDSVTGKEVMELFHKLNQEEGRTIVIITHDHHISQQCERCITIKDGCIL